MNRYQKQTTFSLLLLSGAYVSCAYVNARFQKSREHIPYVVPVALKNLSKKPINYLLARSRNKNHQTNQWDTVSLVLIDHDLFASGASSMLTIKPSTITAAGADQLYVGNVTIGDFDVEVDSPQDRPYLHEIYITWRKDSDEQCEYRGVNCLKNTDVSKQKRTGDSRQAYEHFVILPDGTAVRVAQLFYDGGMALTDGHVIQADGTVKKEATGEMVAIPQGKKPGINADGTLAWWD